MVTVCIISVHLVNYTDPFTRESKEYWNRAHEAETALTNGTWTQRQHN